MQYDSKKNYYNFDGHLDSVGSVAFKWLGILMGNVEIVKKC